MQAAKIVKSAVFAAIGVALIGAIAFWGEGAYLFTVEPDPDMPMAFFYVPLFFFAVMLLTAMRGIADVCRERPYALLGGLCKIAWLGLVLLACLMDVVGYPESFWLLTVCAAFLLLVGIFVARSLRNPPKKPAAQPAARAFIRADASACLDAAVEEYALLNSTTPDVESARERILDLAGAWMGCFIIWAMRRNLTSLILADRLGPRMADDVRRDRTSPYAVIAQLGHRVERTDFAPDALPFIDAYLPDGCFADYAEAVASDPCVYCAKLTPDRLAEIDARFDAAHRRFLTAREAEAMTDAILMPDEHPDFIRRAAAWPAMDAKLVLIASPGVDEAYIARCTDALASSGGVLADAIAEACVRSGYAEKETGRRALEDWQPDLMLIYTPYGGEPAFCVSGEAGFDREHGFGAVVRGGRVLFCSGRVDAESLSPWSLDIAP